MDDLISAYSKKYRRNKNIAWFKQNVYFDGKIIEQ